MRVGGVWWVECVECVLSVCSAQWVVGGVWWVVGGVGVHEGVERCGGGGGGRRDRGGSGYSTGVCALAAWILPGSMRVVGL